MATETPLNIGPGEWFFGRREAPVATLLGSCVAVTLWHPRRHLVGMCHFVLARRSGGATQAPDPRYGNEAVALLRTALARHGTHPDEYRVGIYGGGDMFPDSGIVTASRVGEQNIQAARALTRLHGLRVTEEAVGGFVCRRIRLDPADGRVSVHPTSMQKAV